MNELLNSLTEKLSEPLEGLGLTKDQGTESVKIGVDTVKDKASELLSSGGLDKIKDLIGGGENSETSSVANNFSSNLQSKLGLESGIADKVKALALPKIMEFISQKMGSDFDLSKLTSLLGMDSGIMDKVKDAIGGGLADKVKDKVGSIGSIFGK